MSRRQVGGAMLAGLTIGGTLSVFAAAVALHFLTPDTSYYLGDETLVVEAALTLVVAWGAGYGTGRHFGIDRPALVAFATLAIAATITVIAAILVTNLGGLVLFFAVMLLWDDVGQYLGALVAACAAVIVIVASISATVTGLAMGWAFVRRTTFTSPLTRAPAPAPSPPEAPRL
jgi:hypothetical protein